MITMGLVIYSVVAVALIRPLAGHLAWDRVERHNTKEREGWDRQHKMKGIPSWEQWFGCTLIALCVALTWPVVLAVFVLGRARVGKEQEYASQVSERKRADLAERIGELEKSIEDNIQIPQNVQVSGPSGDSLIMTCARCGALQPGPHHKECGEMGIKGIVEDDPGMPGE